MNQPVSRRNFVKLVVVGMAGGLVAACAAPAAQPTKAPAKPAGKVTLNVWSHFGTGIMGQTLAKSAEDFNKSQNGIEVKVTSVPHPEMWPKVMAAIAAGAPPDTFSYAPVFPPELIKEGHVESVDKYVKWPDDMYSVYDTKINGVRYGISLQGAVKVVFYNKDLFTKVGLDPAKPPKTWDDFVAQGQKLTNEAEKRYGVALPTTPFSVMTEIWSPFLYDLGSDLLTPDNKEAAFNSPAGVEALQFWVDLCQKYKVAPLVSMDGAGLLTNFSTGLVGMVPQSSVCLGDVKQNKFAPGTAPMPFKKQKATFFSGDYFPFMKACKNKEALGQYFQWVLKPESMAIWASNCGALPGTKSARQHQIYQDYLKKDPLAEAALEGIEYAKVWPSVVGIQSVADAVAEALEAGIYDRGKPKDLLDAAAKKVNDILKKNA